MLTHEIIAHRGLNRLAPENTMSAFAKAHEAGCSWIETDIDIISDGTIIICHDSTLDRTTNRSGHYYDLTCEDLDSIDAGSWFADEFRGEKIPTLTRLIDYMNETGLNANIEIKSCEAGAQMSRALVQGIIDELSRLTSSSQVIISSFNHLLLLLLKQKSPEVSVGCLFEKYALNNDWLSILELVDADYIHPDSNGLTRRQVEDFREAGYGVNVWTVNDRARANELFNWGVTGIFSDIADKLSTCRS